MAQGALLAMGNRSDTATLNTGGHVGPSTTLRVNADAPNPDAYTGPYSHASTIYVDPVNGNDANAGTSLAAAVKTWNQAISRITSTGRSCIHIVCQTQTTLYLESTTSGIPSALTSVQSDKANRVYLSMNTSSFIDTTTGNVHWHGMDVEMHTSQYTIGSTFGLFTGAGTNTITFSWCRLVSSAIICDFYASMTATKTMFFIRNSAKAVKLLRNVAVHEYNRCIFANIGGTRGSCIYNQDASLHPEHVYIFRCTYWGFDTVINSDSMFEEDPGFFAGCIIDNCYRDMSGDVTKLNISITESIVNLRYGLQWFDPEGTYLTVTAAKNTVYENAAPMFVDPVNEDFRLVNPAWGFDAYSRALIGHRDLQVIEGLTGHRDFGAWDYKYSQAHNQISTIGMLAETGWELVSERLDKINPKDSYSVKGRFRHDFDGHNRTFTLKYTGKQWVGTDWSDLMMKTLRTPELFFCPNGFDRGLITSNITIDNLWDLNNGSLGKLFRPNSYELTDSDRLFLRTDGLTQWDVSNKRQLSTIQGYLMRLTFKIGATSYTIYARIEEFDGDVFYFEHTDVGYWRMPVTYFGSTVLQTTLHDLASAEPSIIANGTNSYQFNIVGFPCTSAESSMEAVSEYYVENSLGANTKPLIIENSGTPVSYVDEWHLRNLSFKEIKYRGMA